MIERGHVVAPLATRQREVLRLIARFYKATGEFPSVLYIARRLAVHHSVVQDHLLALHAKGWLRTPEPSGLRCTHIR
jgi:Mn-dependent DtxR family transcriptional regulator